MSNNDWSQDDLRASYNIEGENEYTLDDLELNIDAPGYMEEGPLNSDRAQKLLSDNRFLQDVVDYYYERDGASFGSKEEVVEYFFDDRTWRNQNSISLAKDLYDVNTMSEDQTSRLARLQAVFDEYPDFYEDGGRGGKGLWQNIQAIAVDPLNLVGFGSGKVAARTAAAGVRQAQLAAKKAGQEYVGDSVTKAGLKAAAKAGAKGEAIASAGTEALLDTGIQMRNVELGLQDEVSQMQTLATGLTAGAIGGAAGGLFGTAGAVVKNPLKAGARNAIQEGAAIGSNEFRAGVRAQAARDADLEADADLTSQEDLEITEAFDRIDNQIGQELDSRLDEMFPEGGPELEAVAAKVNSGGSTGIPEIDAVAKRKAAIQTLRSARTRAADIRKQADEIATESPDQATALYQQADTLDNLYNRIADAARRGDYDEVEKLLDGAPEVAPTKINTNPEASSSAGNAQATAQQGANVTAGTGTADEVNAILNEGSAAGAPTVGDEVVEATAEAPTTESVNNTTEAATTSSPSAQERYETLETEIADLNRRAKNIRKKKQRGTATEDDIAELNGITARRKEANAEKRAAAKDLEKEIAEAEAVADQNIDPNSTADAADMSADDQLPTETVTTPDTIARDTNAVLDETDKVLDEIETNLLSNPELTAERVGGKVGDILDFFANEIYGTESTSFRTKLVAQIRKDMKELTKGTTKKSEIDAIRKEYVAEQLRIMRMEADMDAIKGRFVETYPDADGEYLMPEAFNPKIMHAMINATHGTDPKYAESLIGMYDKWLEDHSISIMADVIARLGPDASLDDVMSYITDQFGAEVVESIEATMTARNSVIQRISGKLQDIKLPSIEGLPEAERETLEKIREKVIIQARVRGWDKNYTQMALNHIVETTMKGLTIKSGRGGKTYVYSKNGINPLNPNMADHVGRRVEPGTEEGVANRVGRRQGILKKANSQGYFGKLWETMTNQETGATYSAGESARRLIEENYIARGTLRRVKDETKIDQNFDRIAELDEVVKIIKDSEKNLKKSANVRDIEKEIEAYKTKLIKDIKEDPKRAALAQGQAKLAEIQDAARTHAEKVTFSQEEQELALQWRKRINEIKDQLSPPDPIMPARRDPVLEAELADLMDDYKKLQDRKLAQYDAAEADFLSKANFKKLSGMVAELEGKISNPFDNNKEILTLETKLEAAKAQVKTSLNKLVPNLIASLNSQRYTQDMTFDELLIAVRSEKRDLSTSPEIEARGNEVEAKRMDNSRLIQGLDAELTNLRKQQRNEASTAEDGSPLATARTMEIQSQIDSIEAQIRDLDPEYLMHKEVTRLKAKKRGKAKKQLEDESNIESLKAELSSLRTKADPADAPKIEELNKKIAAEEKAIRNALESEDHNQIIARKALAEAEAARRGGAANTPEDDMAEVEAAMGYEADEYDQYIAVQTVDQVARAKTDDHLRNEAIADAVNSFRSHGDEARLTSELVAISAKFDARSHNPQATVPAGKRQPLVVTHKGYEVDVFNHFKKGEEIGSGMDMFAMNFLGEQVGHYQVLAGGKVMLTKRTSAGPVAKLFDSKAAMSRGLPGFFTENVVAAGKQGKLAGSKAPESVEMSEPNWKNTETYKDAEPVMPDEVDAPEVEVATVSEKDPFLDKNVIETLPARPDLDMAIRINTGPMAGIVRVVPVDRAGKVNFRTVLGKQVGQNVEVGYVPKGTSSNSQRARKFFAPAEVVSTDGKIDTSFVAPEAEAPKVDVQPVAFSELQKVELKPDQIDALGGDGRFKTALDVHNAAVGMENVRWDRFKTQEEFQQFVNELNNVYAVLGEALPHGIKYKNSTRKGSMNRLRSIMASRPREEMNAVVNVMRHLSGGDKAMPRFVESTDGYSYRPSSSQVDQGLQNTIGVDINDGLQQPDFAKTIHEIGHWAYMNILSPAERMEFWSGMQKYVREDGVDLAAMKKALPGSASNELHSPAEFFANQFAQYALSNGFAGNRADLASFWSKVYNKFLAVAKRFFTAKEDGLIDEDLIPLFERILPDSPVDERRFTTIAKEMSVGRGMPSMAAKKLDDYQRVRNVIDSSLRSGNPDSVQMALKEFISEAYNLTGKGKNLNRRTVKGNDDMGWGGTSRVTMFDGGGRTGVNIDPNTGKELERVRYPKEYLIKGKMLRLMYEIQRTMRTNNQAKLISLDALDDDAKDRILADSELMQLVEEQMLDDSGDARFTDSYNEQMDEYFEEGMGVYGEDAYMDEAQEALFIRAKQASDAPDIAESEAILEELANEAFLVLHEAQEAMVNAFNRTVKGTKGAKPAIDILGNATNRKVNNRTEYWKGVKKATEARKNAAKKDDFIALANAADEIFETAATSPANKDITPASSESSYKEMSLMELMEAYSKASKSRAKDRDVRVRDISAEIKRRENAAAPVGAPIEKPKTSMVKRAIELEVDDTRGIARDNGIPAHAPMAIQEALTKLTHRNKKVEHTMRTMAYRMANLMGRNAQDLANNQTGYFSVDDVYKMARMPKPEGVDGAMLDLDDLNNPAFNKMRKDMRRFAVGLQEGKGDHVVLMHEIGHVVAKGAFDADQWTAVNRYFMEALEKGDKDAIKAADMHTSDVAAEEWFVQKWAEYLEDRVTVVKDGNLKLRGTVSSMLDRLREYVAYVINGMMGNGGMKQMHRDLTYFGDMLGNKRAKASIVRAVKATDDTGVNSSMAHLYTRELIDNMGVDQSLAAREFTKASPQEDIYNFVYYARNQGTFSENGPFGRGVTMMNPATTAHRYGESMVQLEEVVGDMRPGSRRQQYATYLYERMLDLRDELDGVMNRKISEGETGGSARLKRLLAEEKNIIDTLKRVTRRDDLTFDKVEPFFVRTNKVFDLSDQYYSIDGSSDNSMIWFLESLERKGLLAPGAAAKLITSTRNEITGSDLFALLTNRYMLQDGVHVDAAEAREALSSFIRSLGYDAIRFADKTDDGITYGSGLHIFDPKSLMRVDQVVADQSLRGLRTSRVGGSTKLNGNLALEMMDQDRPFNAADFIAVSGELQRIGAPAALQPILRKMARKEELTGSDIETVQNHTGPNFLRENSSHFRRLGAHWFADVLKPINGSGIFDRHNSDLAKTLTPILSSLRELPDAKNMVGRWLNKSAIAMPVVGGAVAGAQIGTAVMPGLGTIAGALGGMALGNKVGNKIGVRQPASHKRIIDAIRQGRQAVAQLSGEEQKAAFKVIKAFENELDKMRALGIPVGDVRKYGNDFYVPQVWDVEVIRDNYTQFTDELAKFLMRQARSEGEKMAASDATGIAQKIARDMLDGDGHIDISRREVGDTNPFYRRVLRLKPEDHPVLGQFLVNDLEAIATRYFDKTTRKVIMAKEFGAGSHGLNAYRAVAELGTKAAVDILTSAKNLKSVQRVLSVDAEVSNQIVPPIRMTNKEATQFVDRIVSMLGEGRESIEANREMAINMIVSKVPAEDLNPALLHNLRLRAEGVVNALADFGPYGATAHSNVLPQMDRMVNVLNKRPIDDSSGTGWAHRTSHKLRAFNSVTLLGFTTLTSLPDMALPLIRSGKLGAWVKGMQQWYQVDPAYRNAARDIGVGIENLVHDRMVNMAGDGSQRFQNSFFNMTLLTPWTNMQREVAALVGFNALKTEVEVAKKYALTGRTDHRNYKRAVRFLERYGLAGKDLPMGQIDFANPSTPRLDDIKAYTQNDQIRYAVMRFTNEAIFTPNPNDVPMWAQTPWGAVVFQLKSYPVMMGRMSAYIAGEAKRGNVLPAVYMLTAGTGMGAGALALKDLIQQRGGEDERSSALRERTLSKTLEGFGAGSDAGKKFIASMGMTGDDVNDADAAAGWFIDGLFAMGGLGFLGELLYNSAEKLDNGLYGYTRTMGMIGGPTVGLTADAYNLAAGVRDMVTDADTDGKKRQAARIVAGRVPVMGGVKDFKEGIADTAGTAGRKKKAKFNYDLDGGGLGDYEL
jgi:hypothetical protein